MSVFCIYVMWYIYIYIYTYIYIYKTHRQQYGDYQRERDGGGKIEYIYI